MPKSLTLYLQRSYVTVNDSLKTHRKIDLRRGEKRSGVYEVKGKQKRKAKR